MKSRHLFALVTCTLAGVILCGTLVAKRYMRDRTSGPVGVSGQSGGEYDTHDGSQTTGRPFATEYNLLRAVEPFELTERSGEEFDSTDMDGQLWVGSFFFATCPEICRNQNAKISDVIGRFEDAGINEDDVTFLSITVDPKRDTPARLREYAKTFGADGHNWKFLTGEMEKIQDVGKSFGVSIDKGTHASSLCLVDRFGRFRDRFSWDDEKDLERMLETIKRVNEETAAPFDEQVTTRAVPRADKQQSIQYAHGEWNSPEITKDFLLTQRNGRRFDSRDMLGRTWVASFFFSRCPSICKQQNDEIARLAQRLDSLGLTYVSISSDPDYDTPMVLREYAQQFNADKRDWYFLTGEPLQVERIAAERFGVAVAGEMHSTKLILVDRWGNLRGRFSWQESQDLERFRLKLDEVLHEKSPPDEKQVAEDLAAEVAGPEHEDEHDEDSDKLN